MKKFKPALMVLMIMVLAVSLVAAGCGGKDTKQQAAQRDSITIAIPSEPSSLDVLYPDDGNMRMVTENVSESVLAMDGKTLKPVPCLATEYKNTNPTTWDVKLRQDVKFSNGDAFTADDVVFSTKRVLDPNYKSQIVGFFDSISDVKKVNDFEVEFTTKGADPSFPTRLTLLKVMDKKFVEANPDKVKTELIGTGPYKIASWNRGQDITIERNDQYWGTKPAIKTAKYRFIEEDATRAAALKAGEVDLATEMLPEYVKDLPQVKTIDSLEFSLVRFNALRGVMKDPKMRQAACYAINSEALAKSLYQGYADVAQGQVFKSTYAGYDPKLKAYPYDVAKAKQLLQEAGYKGEPVQLVGERGRWVKDGEQIEAIAQMLREAGFNVNVKMLSFQNWLQVLFNRAQAPDMIFTFHSNDIYDADRTYGTYVYTKGPGSSYPDVLDSKIEQARTELDSAKRQQLYEEIGQKIYDDPAWASLINIKDIYGMQKDLQWEPREDMRLTVYEMKLN